MKLTPIHYAVAGVIMALILLGTGFGLGRNSKQCPVYPDISLASDSIRSKFEREYSEREQANRDLWISRMDSAAKAHTRRPIKQQVTDAYRHLTGLPDDSIADRMLATPVVPHIDE